MLSVLFAGLRGHAGRLAQVDRQQVVAGAGVQDEASGTPLTTASTSGAWVVPSAVAKVIGSARRTLT